MIFGRLKCGLQAASFSISHAIWGWTDIVFWRPASDVFGLTFFSFCDRKSPVQLYYWRISHSCISLSSGRVNAPTPTLFLSKSDTCHHVLWQKYMHFMVRDDHNMIIMTCSFLTFIRSIFIACVAQCSLSWKALITILHKKLKHDSFYCLS